MAARPKKPPGNPDPYPPGWEPFLAAINADLDDDTPRLVFADWLQENGDEPRAEFIRLQCAGARGQEDVWARAVALLDENRPRWLLGLPKAVVDRPNHNVGFHRGFVTTLTVTGKQWVTDGERIRTLTPLEELRIDQVWNTVVVNPTLTGLRMLILSGAGSGLIESLAVSPALPSLRALTIQAKSSDGVSQRSFRKLLANPALARLGYLEVASMRLGNVVAECLVNPHLAGLRAIHLCHLSIDAAGADSIARCPAAAKLRSLDLLNNPLEEEGLVHLLASPGLRNLEALALGACHLSPDAARMLAGWEGLRTVWHLDLRHNGLRDADVRVIRESPHAVNLQEVLV